MPKRTFTPEQIVGKLRQMEVLISQCKTVSQAAKEATVRDDAGKLVMECVIETKARTILEFIQGLRGSL